MPRLSTLVCVNATTGDITYTLNGGIFPVAAANGYVLGVGEYDGNLYCLGKGPTKTTVEAPLTSIPLGESIVIKGNVLDMSPAAQDYASKVRFPNGVPAVADEEMSEWMDYLYMQNATLLNNPPKPKGVSVRLSAIDPNNNVIDIGTVTSDSGGMFKKLWTPSIEGEYTIYATFDGSNSYWGSYSETALGVVAAPAAATPEPPQAPPDYTALMYGILVAVIIAIVIGLIALFRKR
jgi:hypothetical protein